MSGNGEGSIFQGFFFEDVTWFGDNVNGESEAVVIR